jgi:AbrB family looped-hinge helix DNA binding protein
VINIASSPRAPPANQLIVLEDDRIRRREKARLAGGGWPPAAPEIPSRSMRDTMVTLTISPKFQVVIPKTIRESLGLSPGQKVQAVLYGNRIELIPLEPAQRVRGFLKGIETRVRREPDRV